MALRSLLLVLLLLPGQSFAQGFSCDNGTVPFPNYRFVQCASQPGSIYTPPGAWVPYPSGWLIPNPAPKNLLLKVHMDGYDPHSLGGINNGFSESGAVVVKIVYGHYPDENLWAALTGEVPWDWGGAFMGGDSNVQRLTATLDEIARRGYPVDPGKGIMYEGNCYGGHSAMNQAILAPDRYRPTIVHATTTGLLMVNKGGLLERNPRAQHSWAGFDLSKADYTQHLDKFKRTYFRVTGAHPYTDDIMYNLDFFPLVCDAGKIACSGQWHDSGHMDSDLKAPAKYDASYHALYTDPLMDYRKDRMWVVFTRASSNFISNEPGRLRGHYNLGLGFNALPAPPGCADVIPVMTDTATAAQVPIRYMRHTNMGPGLNDQDYVSIFDVTLRPVHFTLHAGELVNWEFGTMAGQAIAEDGEVTIPRLRLATGGAFTVLRITRA